MDFKDTQNRPLLKKAISKLMKEYETMLLDLADNDIHKGAILYYWMRDYRKMFKQEKTFNPNFLKKYSRGDVINVNLGFNTGSEQGGLHYAVVVENNDRSSGDITIVPLRSFKNKDNNGIRRTELNLGNELTFSFAEKVKKVLGDFSKKTNALKYKIDKLKPNDKATQDNLSNQLKQLIKEKVKVTNYQKIFNKMNRGSIAIVGQITTISKMKILNPVKLSDTLADIKLSDEKLSMIDEKIKELFTK